jgi:arylsulfatase A-like enzyme
LLCLYVYYTDWLAGKWHLGHFSPRFLPTARGFDTYTGYLNGETHYWSKKEADYPAFVDLIESDRTCYRPYNHSDIEKYSTHFYTDKAVRIIDEHPPGVPLFMYLAYQAVHAPFSDMGKFKDGMPDSYIDNPDVLDHIKDSFDGLMKQEYAKSLYILDQSVNEIYNKLDEKDMLEHTYIIFMSDNGGCVHGGGTNGPLRGSKGSMFEGGIKVDSFIYHHSAFVNATRVFTDLFHISDWAPTMLSLANINYLPEPHHAFDGFSQKDAFFGEPSPRRHILYNMYLDLTESDFDIWHNGSFAVRDNRFKLIHTYDDATFGQWNDPFTAVDGDDDLENDERCAQQFLSGNFTYYLFDLLDDPYELNNIYESHDEEHAFAKQKLYDLLPSFLEKSRTKMKITWSRKAEIVWHSTAGYVVPWADAESLPNRDKSSFPMVCPDVPLENIVGDPTSRPKHKPA